MKNIDWEDFQPELLAVERVDRPAEINLTGKSCGGSCIGGNCKNMPKLPSIKS